MSFQYLGMLTHIDIVVFLYELKICSVLRNITSSFAELSMWHFIIQYFEYKKCGYRQSDHS